MFNEEVGTDGDRRLAAIVFWRGGDGLPFPAPRAQMVAVAHGTPGFSGSKLLFPLKLVVFALVAPFLWTADAIMKLRKRRKRRPKVAPMPMSAAVRAASDSARFENRLLTFGSHRIDVPVHVTLAVFVEDDPAQPDGLSIRTHRIATDPFTPSAPIFADHRDRLRSATKAEKQRILMEMAATHRRSAGPMLAIHLDPVCREFMERTTGA